VTGRDPLIAEHAYGIDTGACHGGRLTALVVPGFELVSVDAHADYWESEKQKWQEPVLLSRPWMEMSFSKAHRELERWREDRTPLIDSIATWLSALESMIPTLQSKIIERAAQIPADSFNQEVEKLPYKALAHLAKRGRLESAAVAERCVSPRRTIELATALGVGVPLSPLH
jgi:serine/threonine protein phosphatase 1